MNRYFVLATLCITGLGGAALAADLDATPPEPSPPLAPGGPRWDGLTIGVNGGGLWSPGQSESQAWYPETITPAGIPNSFTFSSYGGMVGAQAGFNKQWGSFVFGGVADYDYVGGATAKQSGSGTYLGVGYNFAESQQLLSLGTIRARVGFTPIDDTLIYATAGVAFGQTQAASSLSFASGPVYAGSHTDYTVGVAAGGGVEYALGPQWSVGAEFLYYDLGDSHVVGTPNYIAPAGFASPESDSTFAFRGYALRLSVNYLFDASDGSAAPSPSLDPTGEVLGEVGVRAGMSTSTARTKLYDTTGATLLSQLTYRDPSAATGEFYARLDHPSSGLFIKGFAGIGRETGGTLQDEDFPPGTTPYSSTNSSLADGRVGYASADLGYYLMGGGWYKLGAFAGYHYLDERFNAFGCTQTAGNPNICAPGPAAVSSANLAISDEGQWNSVRLGLAGQLTLPAGFSVRAEAAWLPYMSFSGGDDHWLREPVDFSGTIPESGSGSNGYQLEGELDYALSRDFTVGVGGRYWSMNAKGQAMFQNVTPNGAPQVATFQTQRSQIFVQTAYRF
ncbi:MAG: outer membrane beta-barrel protein [Roseiarcus sp.]